MAASFKPERNAFAIHFKFLAHFWYLNCLLIYAEQQSLKQHFSRPSQSLLKFGPASTKHQIFATQNPILHATLHGKLSSRPTDTNTTITIKKSAPTDATSFQAAPNTVLSTTNEQDSKTMNDNVKTKTPSFKIEENTAQQPATDVISQTDSERHVTPLTTDQPPPVFLDQM
jgi:hypothetical protein